MSFLRRSQAPVVVAVLAGIAVAAIGVVRGTWAVGGSDSACYALMTEAFARGTLQPTSRLAVEAPWPDAPLTLAPAGFIPSPTQLDAASPVCMPGFSVLLTPFRWIAGRDGIFLLTPIAGAALVVLAFVVARRLGGGAAGVMAAILVATSPIVLFQVVQPMNDIATAALWMAVLAAACLPDSRRAWVMGMLTGIAVLVRPNLAPVAAVTFVWIIVSRPLRGAVVAHAASFAVGAAPGVAIALFLNWHLYGHPLRLGYGTATDLFSLAHVPTNLAEHGRALIETQTPFPLLALVAPFLLPREHRPPARLALAMVAATLIVYLPYRPYTEWWYLRFLLPALVPLLVLASVATARLLARTGGWQVPIVALATVVLASFGLRTASDRQAFDLQQLEARFRHSADVVRGRLPSNAVLITVWQSGTLRYLVGREAILWDSLNPVWLDRAIVWLQEQQLEPFVVVERWEEPLFRERFAAAAEFGDLDWPPRFDIARQVRVFAVADRAPYLRGEARATEYVWPDYTDYKGSHR